MRCLANYKAKMEVKQYDEVRKIMAHIYEHQPSYFGPELLNSVSSDELKIQKDLIKKGYQRVHEKIKELRQNILAGRSGSVKISDPYYEDLLRIWGGSPGVEVHPLVHQLAI